MTDRERQEVERRVARRFRKERLGDIFTSPHALYRAKEIAGEELTRFYAERDAGAIQWTKPTLAERARDLFRRITRTA